MEGFVLYMEPPTDDFRKAAEQYVGQRFVSKLQVRGFLDSACDESPGSIKRQPKAQLC